MMKETRLDRELRRIKELDRRGVRWERRSTGNDQKEGDVAYVARSEGVEVQVLKLIREYYPFGENNDPRRIEDSLHFPMRKYGLRVIHPGERNYTRFYREAVNPNEDQSNLLGDYNRDPRIKNAFVAQEVDYDHSLSLCRDGMGPLDTYFDNIEVSKIK